MTIYSQLIKSIKMKKSIKSMLFSSVLLLMTFSFTNVQAQDDPKVDKAMAEFCNSVNVFVESLIILDEASGSGSDDAFNEAYNKSVKDWDKVQKAAEKVEKVEMKESVKAYNNLANTVNRLSKDGVTDDEAKQINAYIKDTAEEINAILSASCQ